MAEWVYANAAHDLRPKCSACGNLFPIKTDYCPHCGKPMENSFYSPAIMAEIDKSTLQNRLSNAVMTLVDEYDHVCHHLTASNKDESYYNNMLHIADAMAMGIVALKKWEESLK